MKNFRDIGLFMVPSIFQLLQSGCFAMIYFSAVKFDDFVKNPISALRTIFQNFTYG
jgi:hypothetical protein